MIIRYDSPKLELICNDEKVATKEVGLFSAKKLKRIMTYLNAAVNFEQIKRDSIYGFHGLRGDRSGQYAMDLHGASRITFYFLDGTDVVVFEDNDSERLLIDEITD